MEDCPECGGKMWGMEYTHNCQAHYDGVSEWQCCNCGIRVGRWTGRILGENELEWPYGKGTKERGDYVGRVC